MDGAVGFEVLYSKWLLPLFLILGLGPSFTRVELNPSELRVRMGWGFSADIPRSSIRLPERSPDRPWAIGIHTNMRVLAREGLVERERLAEG